MGNKQAAADAMDRPAPGSSAKTSISTSLGVVDACSLLTPVDFATATDKVQPQGFPASSYTLRTQKVKTDVSPAVDQHSACTYYFSGKPGASGEITLDVSCGGLLCVVICGADKPEFLHEYQSQVGGGRSRNEWNDDPVVNKREAW